MNAYIAGITYVLPDQVVTNADLAAENPDWDMPRIEAKVGIKERRVAQPDECASDLGFRAASKLLVGMDIDPASIDFLLFCTQSPDYFLPTTACVLQDRLGLPTSCGALDINQGCSGYVYGLHMARSLIVSGAAHNVLVVTAETYSKFIHPKDRSVRVLFGDAASATLITDKPGGALIGPSTLGTDGSGHQNLIVPAGGMRKPRSEATCVEVQDEAGQTRTEENLFMDGQELFLFTLKRVPETVDATLARCGLGRGDIDWYIFHQANAFMNDRLRVKLGIPKERAPFVIERYGNTVSNTIPMTLREVGGNFTPGQKVLLVGFGVGYSWGSCLLTWDRVALV